MNRKRVLLIMPTILLPYLVLLVLATIFFFNDVPFFAFILESVFHSNAIDFIASLLLYCLCAAVLSVVCFVFSIRKRWSALSLAKTAMIVKLIQAPAYALIFVLGVLLTITIFTIPFSVGLFLLDCVTLFLTGLITAAAAINAVRQGVLKANECIWITLLQLVFCGDVIASIYLYLKLRRSTEIAYQN